LLALPNPFFHTSALHQYGIQVALLFVAWYWESYS